MQATSGGNNLHLTRKRLLYPVSPSGTSLNNFALQSLNYFDNMWFVSYKILLVEFKYAVVLCSRGNFGNSRNCEKFISSLCFYMFLSGITPNWVRQVWGTDIAVHVDCYPVYRDRFRDLSIVLFTHPAAAMPGRA